MIKNLVTAFSNITQVRYSKNPQSYSTQEYNELINISLKTIISIVSSIFDICYTSYPPLKNSLNNEINVRLSFGDYINKPENPFNFTQNPTEINNEIKSNLKKKI